MLKKLIPHDRWVDNIDVQVWVLIMHVNVSDMLSKPFVLITGRFIQDQKQ